jgi:monofunctional biosynthetic peptidoglycan transglycosylase
VLRRLGRAAAAVAAFAFAIPVYVYLTLPDVRPLRRINPASTAFMQMRLREMRARGDETARLHRWTPYNRISEHLKRAVLVAEDSAFFEHDGIDFEQIQKSLEINFELGRIARGGSTITQQLAKNLYLSPSRNPLRKARELFIARRLEAELSKRRILEIYLNVIEWGEGIWGAEAAARAHFGKSAAALTAPEAALLAAAIINPRVLSPARPSERLRQRQRLILRRMRYVEPPPAAPDMAPLPEVAPLPGVETLPGEELPPEPPPPIPVPKPIPLSPQ